MSSPAYERPNRSVNGANQNNGNSDELDVRHRAAPKATKLISCLKKII